MPPKKRKIVEDDLSPEDEKVLREYDSVSGYDTVKERARAVRRACEEAEDPSTAARIITDQYDRCKSDASRLGLALRVWNKPRSFVVALWGLCHDAFCSGLVNALLDRLVWVMGKNYTDGVVDWYRRYAWLGESFRWMITGIGPAFVDKLERVLEKNVAATVSRSSTLIPDLAAIVAGFCRGVDCDEGELYQTILFNQFDLEHEYRMSRRV